MWIENATQIKEILAPIPEDQFIVGELIDYTTGKSCAIGHINKHIGGHPLATDTGYGARSLTDSYLKGKGFNADIASVNNRPVVNGYTEETPKARVMHLVEDMIRDGY